MKRAQYILALIGGTLVLVPIYLQSVSMDLNRFTLSQYIVSDAARPEWWSVVAFPFLVGVSFLVVAAICTRTSPSPKITTGVLIVCLAIALLLCVVNSLGLLAVIPLLTLLVGSIRRVPAKS